MTILYVLEFFHPHIGGVETLFQSLCTSVAKDHRVIVVTTRHRKDLPTHEVVEGVEIHRVNLKNRYLFTLLGFFAVWRKAKGCDLIHTTSYNAALPAFLVGWMKRKPVIITFHEVWQKLWFALPRTNRIAAVLHFTFEWMLLQLPFRKYIAVSNFTADKLRTHGVNRQRVGMIYNGINYEQFEKYKADASNEQFRFLYFGRIGISKGVGILIRAYAELMRDDADAELELILPKDDKKGLKKVHDFIGRFGLDNIRISHSTDQHDLFKRISDANAVVIPSYSEGFCFAAVEAAALKKPIIHSNRGALQETVSGKYLTYNHPDSNDLAKVMSKAIQGQWLERDLRHFPLSKSVDAYSKLYDSLL